MKRTILICLVIALTFCLTACGCKHEWQEATCLTPKTCTLCQEVEGEALGHSWKDATCTAPKTCETCQETEGSSLGHSYGEEEMVNPNYVAATATFVKTCSTCNAQESRDGTIDQLHNGSVILMSADDFSARFTEKLMEVQTLLGNDQYLSMITEDDGIIGMYLCRRSNGNITEPGFFVMRDLNDENVPYSQHADACTIMGIVGLVKGGDQTAIALISMIATMHPTLELETVIQYASDLINAGSLKLDGLTYTYTPMDSTTSMLGFTVHE